MALQKCIDKAIVRFRELFYLLIFSLLVALTSSIVNSLLRMTSLGSVVGERLALAKEMVQSRWWSYKIISLCCVRCPSYLLFDGLTHGPGWWERERGNQMSSCFGFLKKVDTWNFALAGINFAWDFIKEWSTPKILLWDLLGEFAKVCLGTGLELLGFWVLDAY